MPFRITSGCLVYGGAKCFRIIRHCVDGFEDLVPPGASCCEEDDQKSDGYEPKQSARTVPQHDKLCFKEEHSTNAVQSDSLQEKDSEIEEAI
jgi:hypothetical protein